MRKEKHAVAASAAAPVSKNAHDCSFVSAGVFELLFLLKPAAAFVGLTRKIFMRAVAAPAAAWTLLHVFGVPFAMAGLCHVIGICWNILDLMHWKCVCQEDLARFAQGSCKKQSYTLSKVQSSDSLLQASTQALTLEDDGDLVTFKGLDGHSIDGSPSLGKGQATGRVDVSVDAIATSFGYVDVALLHRSPQCVVLVNQGSHVEKKEKTVFVNGGGREDQGATCGGLHANLGTLG